MLRDRDRGVRLVWGEGGIVKHYDWRCTGVIKAISNYVPMHLAPRITPRKDLGVTHEPRRKIPATTIGPRLRDWPLESFSFDIRVQYVLDVHMLQI
jgi:hypothetical protein